ncbi:MAG: hypothetical protein KF754_12915 [Planctomycetes bacterium]|nr:hypothetical protein [Planctomycetota bacterium]
MNHEPASNSSVQARPALPWFGAQGGLLVLLFSLLFLAGCTMPQEEPLPDGVTDQRADLVERIKDNPTDLDAHADLLRMQIKSGDRVGAEATVAHALKNNSRDFRSHLLEAQYHRWQLDLITTEKSLLRARTLAPDRLEPCVALAGLYNQAYLDAEELQLRRVALELATPELRPEFLLDLAYCLWQQRQGAEASTIAAALAADKAIPPGLRARSLLLQCELALNGDAKAAGEHLSAAFALTPEDPAVLQFAARAVVVMADPGPLRAMFDQTLAGKDRAELRWTALFGIWMLELCRCGQSAANPLADEVDGWRKRLEAMEPGHPDVSGRYYQLLRLDPQRADEAKSLGTQLEEYGMGVPPAPTNLAALLLLWRLEDSLRVGAFDRALVDVAELRKREGNLEGTRMLGLMARFKARQDDICLAEIDAWLAENEKADDILLSLRWWILLRQAKPLDVLTDIQKRGGENNSRQWLEAVAKFHTYRAAARKGE